MSTTGEIVLTVVNLFLGTIVGFYYNEWKNKRRKRTEQQRINTENNQLYEAFMEFDKDKSANRGIVHIAHGVPYFEPTAQTTYVDNEMVFYYPIPEANGLKEELALYGFVQTNKYKLEYADRYNCLSHEFPFKANFDEAFSCFGNYSWDKETKTEIAQIANEVANEFLYELKDGKPRFNGSMLGVKNIILNRDDLHDERSTLRMEYYISDYFSFRVFAKFYIKHINEFRALHDELGAIDVTVLQKLSMPFLSSFGVATIIIGTAGNIFDNEDKLYATDIIISGQRGGNVIVDRNRIHFGMNEAFSYSMDSDHNNTPSYTHCVFRGITEELLGYKLDSPKGKQYEQYIGTPYFLDLIFDSNKCEMGIIAYIKLKLSMNENEGFTPKEFLDLYNEAKDRTLETESLKFTQLSDLDMVINENEKEMSNSYYVALKNLKRRIGVGSIYYMVKTQKQVMENASKWLDTIQSLTSRRKSMIQNGQQLNNSQT